MITGEITSSPNKSFHRIAYVPGELRDYELKVTKASEKTDMIIKPADSIESFLRVVDAYHKDGWIYRGVTDKKYELIPRIGRPEFRTDNLEKTERLLLQTFKQRAIRHVSPPPTSELEWLALGQHHGLPTRLLDWSYSPLVALYFAVSGDKTNDAAVYCRHMSRGLNVFDPFNPGKAQKYYPPHISARIPAQHALFTVELDPTQPPRIRTLVKIIIPAGVKMNVRIHLSLLGFHNESMFPDLDGACAHLTWRLLNRQGAWPNRITTASLKSHRAAKRS